jgi:hypothetical protein
MDEAALGFRVKSGWAMAVLLAGPSSSPKVIDRRRIELADPAVPDSVQPFHAGLDLSKALATRTVGRLVKAVEQFAARSVKDLLEVYRSDGYRVTAAGLVVGSTVDPETIKNDHIRAHAEEGRLFRIVIEGALKAVRLDVAITPEKELFSSGANALGVPETRLRIELTLLGKTISGSWRAEEKAATLAAWIALAGHVGQPTLNRTLQKKN